MSFVMSQSDDFHRCQLKRTITGMCCINHFILGSLLNIFDSLKKCKSVFLRISENEKIFVISTISNRYDVMNDLL